MSRQSDDPNEKRAARPDVERPQRQRRIVAEVPEKIHRLVRLRCIERGILVRDYILELLAKDGIT
jgi:hypothetical protein